MDPVVCAAFVDELIKIASDVDQATDAASAVRPDEETPPSRRQHPGWDIARGIGGFALGAGVGMGGAHLLNQGVKAVTGNGIPPGVLQYAAPAATMASGLGFAYLQHKMLKRMQDAHAEREARKNGDVGGIPDDRFSKDTGF